MAINWGSRIANNQFSTPANCLKPEPWLFNLNWAVTSPEHRELQLWLQAARKRTDDLFAIVHPDSLYERPIAHRHRLIFYVGHLEAFDWNHIGCWSLQLKSSNPVFDRLFEAGIDPDAGHLPSDTAADWPRLEEVRQYCSTVRSRIDENLDRADPWIAQMAIEHRLMHTETLIYQLHNLPFGSKVPPARISSPTAQQTRPTVPSTQTIDIAAGIATLGRCREYGFGWDNEFNEHRVNVSAFAVDAFKVTNGQWLEFVGDGGPVPHYWQQRNGSWLLTRMFDATPLPLDHPVFVTQEQASQYAGWRGGRLMTEAEFHRAAYGHPDGTEREYPWGSEEPQANHGNFNGRCWGTVPVDSTPGGDSAWGVSQLVGNGWEWTCTAFGPFEGFEAAPNYPGYSTNFFDGRHAVIKGASQATDRCFLRRSFRNWFRTDYPYVYSTFRCVRS